MALATQLRVAFAQINMYGNTIIVIPHATRLAPGSKIQILAAKPIGIQGILCLWTAGKYANNTVIQSTL